jgi:hypothetical protein
MRVLHQPDLNKARPPAPAERRTRAERSDAHSRGPRKAFWSRWRPAPVLTKLYCVRRYT